MISRKKTITSFEYPGRPELIDGTSAVLDIVRRASDLVAMGEEWQSLVDDRSSERFRRARDGRSLAGLAAGAAATGLRGTVLCAGSTLVEMRESLAASSARRLPYVVHHLCTPTGATASHEPLFAVADTGAFQLFARNVEEAADYALIARHAAEAALTPGIVVEDLTLTGTALQTIRMPEPGLADRFLGAAGDHVDSLTPAQEMIFGPLRRRVPRALDVDAPAGAGMAHDEDTAAEVRAARDVFFHEDLPRILDRSFEAFGELTGRRYARATGYRLNDAEYVVVAQGAIVEDLEAVADYLRKHERVKAGVLNLASIRPFPGPLLTELLKGCKVATVLEHDGHVLAQDPPLLQEVRGALERASENGRARGEELPHPEYEAFRKATDRPELISAINPGGRSRPTFADLRALFLNMREGPLAKQRFYVGSRLGQSSSRLPAAEHLQQKLIAAFPAIGGRVLGDDRAAAAVQNGCGAFHVRTFRGWDGEGIGRRIASAMFHGPGGRIRTVRYGQEHAAGGATYVVAHSPTGLPPEILRGSIDALVVSSPSLLAGEGALASLGEGGVVVVQTALSPEKLWAQLSAEVRRAIRERQARLYAVDARSVAAGLVDDSQMIPLLATQALAGAFVAVYMGRARSPSAPKNGHAAEIQQHYLEHLAAEYTARPDLQDYFEQALRKGSEAVRQVSWKDIQLDETPVPERPSPWAVRGSAGHAVAAADLVRAWETSGYLRATGRQDEVVTDPLLALGTMPARSSAFRSTETSAERMARLLAENCTACGSCWTWCPDAAMPTTVQDFGSLLGTAMTACTKDGVSLIQLQRVGSHLVKQAHKLLADDELSRYLTLDHLLGDAIERLIERMQMRDDQREALLGEFAHVRARMEGFPIVKSDAFFRDREKAEKGSGLAFALAIDPDACKGCGLCAEVCPEGALEMLSVDPVAAATARQARDFLFTLPDTPVAKLRELDPKGVDTAALPLINRQVYHTLVGGDDSPPGNGARTALHFVLAAAEASQQEHSQLLAERIESLVTQIDELLQTKINGVLKVGDVEQLGRKLITLKQERVGLHELVRLMEDDERERVLDTGSIERLSGALSALRALSRKYADGRSRMALALGASEKSRWQHSHPHNPFAAPWIYHLEHDAPAVAEGLFEGVMRVMADTFQTVREAELLLNDTYLESEHAPFFEAFGPDDFTEEEWRACPPLIVVADEFSEQIDELLRSDLPVRILLMSAERQDAALGALAHGTAFVLQSTPAHAQHLWKGIEEALSFRGPALFHLYGPDPAADGTAPEETAELARMAVESRAFPLFTYDPRRGTELQERLSLTGNPATESDWATGEVTVEMPNGLMRRVEVPVLFADWAARQGRFFGQFTFVPKRDWDDRMIRLHEYLALDSSERGDRQPYVEVPGAAGTPVRKLVSKEMVTATEARQARWRLLLEMAGVRSSLADRIRKELEAEMEHKLEAATAEIAAEHEAKLAEQERTHAERYHAALSRQLLALSGYGEGSEEAKTALRALMAESNGDEVPHARIS